MGTRQYRGRYYTPKICGLERYAALSAIFVNKLFVDDCDTAEADNQTWRLILSSIALTRPMVQATEYVSSREIATIGLLRGVDSKVA